MKITVAAIGRLKAGAERDLAERYLDRASKMGRQLGLSIGVRELPESRAANPDARKQQEAAAILAVVPPAAVIVVLDERGKALDSHAFAESIRRWRDAGTAEVVMAIGGADGHGQPLLNQAALRLAFGGMTWPHQLVRLMLVEQIYRAMTILAGHPYHRN
jgi:23S rRNA (pseudouridine1915-N3)-methyltransferase